MTEEERDIILFESYRNGDLSDSERMEFDARLSYDAEFNQAFIEFQFVEEGIKTHYRNELKLKLQEVDKKMDIAPQKSKTLRLVMWSSSVAAAILIGVFIFQHFSTPNNVAIAQQYWPHEEGLPVKMSSKAKYDDAMNAFKLEKWDKAERLLLKIDSDTSDYFLGIINYQQKDSPQSIIHFNEVRNQSAYFQEAQFRLSLVFLSQNKLITAKKILQKQIDHKTKFAKTSKEILEKMK